MLTGQGSTGKSGSAYLQYLQHLSNTQPALTTYESFTKGYEDFIEIPLQVMDRLFRLHNP